MTCRLCVHLFALIFLIALGLGTVTAQAQAPPLSDSQRQAMRSALDQAQRGPFELSSASALRNHPLYGWLEYSVLRRNIDNLSTARAQAFLQRYQGQVVADALLNDWLPALARKQDWATFLAHWRVTHNTAQQCIYLQARLAAGQADTQWNEQAQAIWRSAGKSLPSVCDPVFAALQQRGGLNAELRWQRIEAAAQAREFKLMRFIARGLNANDRAQAEDYAAFIEKFDQRALNWPRTTRSRQIATIGLVRLARSNPDLAEQQLPQYVQVLALNTEQQAQVRYQIALQSAANWHAQTARRLAQVPESAFDVRLHEWRVREAIARSDWRAALAGIEKMPAQQRNDSRWQWFAARMLEKTGRRTEAHALYQAAARQTTFHGFMAADKLNQPYALCPLALDEAQTQHVRQNPALIRALELFKIDRRGWALREWNQALSTFDQAQRQIAVTMAGKIGWYDRAVFNLKDGQDLRLYELRFPLAYRSTLNTQAQQNRLDPAWVAAVIRAESIFNTQARSPADARGLMQILPSTGAQVAKHINMNDYSGAARLFDPDTNITLGTAYLRQLLDEYENLPFAVMAAYNAGPNALARWRNQRGHLETDLWIETIGYKETREYVARVMAFTVIYDWRLHGNAQPLSERLRGHNSSTRKGFACPQT